MPLIEQVPIGALVVLDCGCRGYRMAGHPGRSVLVIVMWPCDLHEADGRAQLREVEPLTDVSPFIRPDE
jgi:hypothetical protein